MRKIFAYSFLSAALLASGACKKSHEEKAQTKYEKAKEDVNEQRKDVTKDQNDMSKQKRELGEARQNLQAAQAEYKTALKQNISDIDTRISELDAKGDAASHTKAAKLKVKRDDLAKKLDQVDQQTPDTWNQFKKDTDTQSDQLKNDMNKPD